MILQHLLCIFIHIELESNCLKYITEFYTHNSVSHCVFFTYRYTKCISHKYTPFANWAMQSTHYWYIILTTDNNVISTVSLVTILIHVTSFLLSFNFFFFLNIYPLSFLFYSKFISLSRTQKQKMKDNTEICL